MAIIYYRKYSLINLLVTALLITVTKRVNASIYNGGDSKTNQIVPPKTLPKPCLSGYFACNTSDECVEQRFNCDRKPDCSDGSDELNCDNTALNEYYNKLFKKRPDEDREKTMKNTCDLRKYPRDCMCSERNLFCNGIGLNSVPTAELPNDVKELDLSANYIQRIVHNDFEFNARMEILILTSSNVTTLSAKAFVNLPNLKKLYFSGNLVTQCENKPFAGLRNLTYLQISHNRITTLHNNCFNGLQKLKELDLRNGMLEEIHSKVFNSLVNLEKLWLDNNYLRIIPNTLFHNLNQLEILSLSKNAFTYIDHFLFDGIHNLRTLSLHTNMIASIEMKTFGNLSKLFTLDLHDNRIANINEHTFYFLEKLQSLDLRSNPLSSIPSKTLIPLKSLTHVYFDEFRFCSYALHVRVCEPRSDGISSFAHLLDNIILRVFVWFVAIVACAGNLSVLLGRILIREPNLVHSLYIKNLSIADFIMGIYLLIIGAHDLKYRGQYILHQQVWRNSWSCSLAGSLSTLSSEASVLILAVITMDRYVSIIYPLTARRRSVKSAWSLVMVIWFIAILISVIPLIPVPYFDFEYYGSNGVCLPLYIHNPYSKGWHYSFFVFYGINSVAFAFILGAYLHMFVTITKSSFGLRNSSMHQNESVIAMRFAFIVGTDFVCWAPIIVIKIVAMSGFKINEDLYSWVAVFLLPVNAALNPILYTLTTRLFRQQFAKIVYSWRSAPSIITDHSPSGGREPRPQHSSSGSASNSGSGDNHRLHSQSENGMVHSGGGGGGGVGVVGVNKLVVTISDQSTSDASLKGSKSSLISKHSRVHSFHRQHSCERERERDRSRNRNNNNHHHRSSSANNSNNNNKIFKFDVKY